MNNFKTWMLMSALMVILVFLGQLIGGSQGMIIFFAFGLIMNFVSYFYSDKIAVAMTRSKKAEESQVPELFTVIRNLSQRADIPMPKVYITPSSQPNAFATGRGPGKAVVAVTDGLLRLVNRTELEGVIAHELAHVKNRDILIGSIAAAIAGAVMMIANMARFSALFFGRDDEDSAGGLIGILAISIIAPIAAMIVQMAISRSREYQADISGADIAGNPLGLADALLKLNSAAKQVPMNVSPASAHMFIVNPLAGRSFINLFSTHPSIENRVERLRSMAGII